MPNIEKIGKYKEGKKSLPIPAADLISDDTVWCVSCQTLFSAGT